MNPHGGYDWIFLEGAFCLFCRPNNDDLCLILMAASIKTVATSLAAALSRAAAITSISIQLSTISLNN